jgi:hypothetical protein
VEDLFGLDCEMAVLGGHGEGEVVVFRFEVRYEVGA